MSKCDYVFLLLCLYDFVLMPYYLYASHICLCALVTCYVMSQKHVTTSSTELELSVYKMFWHTYY